MCVRREEDRIVDISGGNVHPLVVLVLKAGLLNHPLACWDSHLIFFVQSILSKILACQTCF